MKKINKLCCGLICCGILCGCAEKRLTIRKTEKAEVNISESKISQVFSFNENGDISDENLAKIDKLLKDAKAEGLENVGFMVMAEKVLPPAIQKKITDQVSSHMRRAGFWDSRIVNSGICVYSGAQRSVRIDLLKYEIDRPYVGPWRESDGDCDVTKPMPNKGASGVWNLEEMVANKADLISPRTYSGQHIEMTMKAVHEGGISETTGKEGGISSQTVSSGQ